mgnify:CR=1 FL=1
MSLQPDRAAIVAAAAESITRGSKSFALSSKLFEKTTRERAWLLYSWCRRCDDLADGQDHGGERQVVVDPMARLDTIRSLTDAALAGQPTGDPAFDALGLVARECQIPRRFINDHIAGFALDAEDWSPRTEDDLLRYCYHVAGVVGCMIAVVMGVDPQDDETLDRACDLGLAFQLANIARDISEDDAVGRCYLPVDWLVEADMQPGEHMRPHFRSRLADMAWWLANMVGEYWAVLAAAGIYGDIARKVDALDHAAWDQRVMTTKAEKFGWVARALGQAIANRPKPVSRDGLWQRPR